MEGWQQFFILISWKLFKRFCHRSRKFVKDWMRLRRKDQHKYLKCLKQRSNIHKFQINTEKLKNSSKRQFAWMGSSDGWGSAKGWTNKASCMPDVVKRSAVHGICPITHQKVFYLHITNIHNDNLFSTQPRQNPGKRRPFMHPRTP